MDLLKLDEDPEKELTIVSEDEAEKALKKLLEEVAKNQQLILTDKKIKNILDDNVFGDVHRFQGLSLHDRGEAA